MKEKIEVLLNRRSDKFNNKYGSIALVMAAGHGKRIKSSLPKVMHAVWGVPSVVRVLQEAQKGLNSPNQVVVVGKCAEEVSDTIGHAKHRIYAFQKKQLGTGDALRTGIEAIPATQKGNVFVFPGDLGMLDREVIQEFLHHFENNNYDMMMLTGIFDGPASDNFFGRVVRVPSHDADGVVVAPEDVGNVICILQQQDLFALKPKRKIELSYRNSNFLFTREQLLNIHEFDSGVFAFKINILRKNLSDLGSENVQKEYYLTDLVKIYNVANYNVGSYHVENSDCLLGFNDKTLWRKIEGLHRARIHKKIQNIIDIEDSQRFFIDEILIGKLLVADKKSGPLDIFLGSDVWLGREVVLEKNIYIKSGCSIEGKVTIKEGAHLGSDVVMRTLPGQKISIGKNVILQGANFIQGNVVIEDGAVIGEGVNITGSNEYPCIIGKKSNLQGSCYIYGSKVAAGCIVQSSILIRQNVQFKKDKLGNVIGVRFVIPPPQGKECLYDI